MRETGVGHRFSSVGAEALSAVDVLEDGPGLVGAWSWRKVDALTHCGVRVVWVDHTYGSDLGLLGERVLGGPVVFCWGVGTRAGLTARPDVDGALATVESHYELGTFAYLGRDLVGSCTRELSHTLVGHSVTFL